AALVFVLRLRRRRPPITPLFPYTTLFRSAWLTTPWLTVICEAGTLQRVAAACTSMARAVAPARRIGSQKAATVVLPPVPCIMPRSEEHTSELQSRENLVCRLLLEKKKQNK